MLYWVIIIEYTYYYADKIWATWWQIIVLASYMCRTQNYNNYYTY